MKLVSKHLILLFLLAIGCAAPHVAAGGARTSARRANLLWPLPIAINLTSSFGEYRSGHFHAGLDIKTYGREDVPCRAVAAGYVSRLRASPFGYGQAVYLKLESGQTAVYAHLSEFAPVLDTYVYAEQVRAGRYEVDLFPEPGRFPVARGDIIAYTGKTGANAPHLHFEMRDPDENPINPLSLGLEVEDDLRPGFRGLLCVPVAATSRIDGVCAAKQLDLEARGDGAYVARDTVRLSGRVGLGAYIVDRLNGESGRLAPYRVEVEVDGRTVADIALERFSYGHTRQVELAYDMGRVRRLRQNYLLLFEREGETLWNRSFEDGGVIDVDHLPLSGDDRVHTAVIRTIDRAGHTSTATLYFHTGEGEGAGHPGTSPAFERDGIYVFDGLLTIGRGRLVHVSGDLDGVLQPASTTVDLRTVLDGSFSTVTVDRLHGKTYVFAGDGEDPSQYPYVLPLEKGEVITQRFAGMGITIKTNGESLYSDAFVFVRAWPADIASTNYRDIGLVPAHRPIKVGPLSLAIRDAITIDYHLDRAATGREAVFRLDETKREWEFDSASIEGDVVSANVRSPGVYGVFVDSIAPVIGTHRIDMVESHATGIVRPEIAIPLIDAASGIDPDVTIVYLDGHKQIARWDSFSENMFILIRDQNIIGTHALAVTAVDRVGNSSTREERIQIPEQQKAK